MEKEDAHPGLVAYEEYPGVLNELSQGCLLRLRGTQGRGTAMTYAHSPYLLLGVLLLRESGSEEYMTPYYGIVTFSKCNWGRMPVVSPGTKKSRRRGDG